MSTRLAIWGAGGHAIVVADIIRLSGDYEIVGLLDDINADRRASSFHGYRILGGREQLELLRADGVDHLIFGFGQCHARLELARLALDRGFAMVTAIHPTATVALDATIGPGTVIAAAAVVNPGSTIGSNVIINTSSSVDHECVVEDGAHVSPGVHLAGRVTIERGAWVGIGATVVDRVRIGAGSVIGAGAVVVSDIPPGVLAHGVPARVVKKLTT